MVIKSLRIQPRDNVEVALTDLSVGKRTGAGNEGVILVDDVPAKHKYATQDLEVDGAIIMYGVLVGKAVVPIRKGALISTSNIRHASDAYRVSERKTAWIRPDVSQWKDSKTGRAWGRERGWQ